MNIFEWFVKHQHVGHALIGFFLSLLGTLWTLFLGATLLIASISGISNAVIWFTAKEATDETCHDALVKLDLKGVWDGWSWSDYLVGIGGGILGVPVGILIFVVL